MCRAALVDPRISNDMAVAAQRWPEAVPAMYGALSMLSKHMLTADPPDHTRLRRLVGSAFTAGRVKAMTAGIESITAGLLGELAGCEVIDLIATFARPLPVRVICELLGVPADTQEKVTGQVQTLLFTAGHETTVNLIGNGVLALLTNPDQMARVLADPGQSSVAIEELLRFGGPLRQAVSRIATEAGAGDGPVPLHVIALVADIVPSTLPCGRSG